MRILIIEDDERLAAVLQRGFRERGDVADVSHTGEDALDALCESTYDAVVLDVALPKIDGLAVVRELRRRGVVTPVILATSRDTPEDVVEGLDAGADDYVRKPFAFKELAARLRSATRRVAPPASDVLHVAGVSLDLQTRRVERDGRALELTARELAFLEYFMRNAGRVLSRAALERALWDRTSETTSNVVDVYVRRLRVKLDAAASHPVLHTIRGLGYRFGP